MKLPQQELGGFFLLQAKTELESFGLPLHLQTGVWSFMRLNKKSREKELKCGKKVNLF